MRLHGCLFEEAGCRVSLKIGLNLHRGWQKAPTCKVAAGVQGLIDRGCLRMHVGVELWALACVAVDDQQRVRGLRTGVDELTQRAGGY